MSNEVESKTVSVQLLEYQRPGLTAGDYEIEVTQEVEISKHPAITKFTAKQKFTVAGDRFELKPTDVLAVFPPDGNLGEHINVLPHIVLNRSTLPWERLSGAQATGVPWLALLLFDEDEKPKSETLTLEKLGQAGTAKFPLPLKLESGQHKEDLVTVIDVPASRLEKIMPAAEELALLAHVRFGANAEGNSTGEELAIVISNRLPQPNKTSIAHLVSVEGRFAANGKFNYQATGNDLVRLVSLKSWSFTCESPTKNFHELLRGLNKTVSGPAALRLPPHGAATEKFLSRGYVLLPHYFRHGDQTASWFHGPLIPGHDTSPKIKLPARTADELLRYDPALSMFDVSYAAAWELGRLLALQDKAFSTGLYQWKRQRAQRLAQTKQFSGRLPFQKETSANLPDDIALWLDSLRKLEGVPFNYLVPDERMLPAESIRFFRVDNLWVDCLTDGALSIGRVSSSDHAADKLQAKKLLTARLGEPCTGFLLRSEVVSGWPGLLVDAYANDGDKPRRLDVVRMERLDAGVLLCVFKGQIATAEIYLKPETLHFGLDLDGSVFYKKLRKPDSGESLKDRKVKVEPNSQRIVDVKILAQSLKTELKLSDFTSSHFALQMMEGAEKVIFSI